MVALPLVFVVVFLGYFPMHYDIELKVADVDGEGICQSYGSQADGRTAVNAVSFYFGSELETATIKNFYYDVDALSLITSDVSSFDIVSIDSYVRGIHMKHFDAADILADGEQVKGTRATLSSEGGVLHVEVADPKEGATVTISQDFIPLWFWIAYFAIIVLLSAVVAVLIEYLFRLLPSFRIPLLCSSTLLVVLLAGCYFCGSLSYMVYANFLLNWLFLLCASLLMGAITGPVLGSVLTATFVMFWYVANYFVITFRGKPIMPADIRALGTATEVMGGYTFVPSQSMIVGLLIATVYIVTIVVLYRTSGHREERPLKKRLAARGLQVALAFVLAMLGLNSPTFSSLSSFAWDTVLLKSFHEEGMVLTFLKSAINSRVDVPTGYSRDKVNAYLAEYESVRDDSNEGPRATNIIMVMGEAFSDLRSVGLDERIDVMPFIDSLDKNTAEGSLYVSVFGGGTCNTEFEALTGNSLAFLGVSAYPYTDVATEPTFSLASYFRDMGYLCEAFHPNEAQNWNRNIAYPNLGFDKFHSIADFESFGDVVTLHDLPADINDYRYIESIDKKNEDKPRFLFDVTMQNHSPYERWLDVEPAASVQKYGNGLYQDAQVYLSLIKASDDEVRQLVDTYSNSTEPTMIIYFGDHQPGLPDAAVNQIYTGVGSNLDLYKTKFFIWTSYGTRSWHDAGISANYLPWLVLERGNLPKPPFVRMLEELYSKYPIVSSQGVMGSDGTIYDGVNDERLANDPLIKKYQYVQYANLFDEIDDAWFAVKDE